MVRAVAESSDKVSRDLQGIFGSAVDDSKKVDDEESKKKKKRSSDEMKHQNPDKSHETKLEIEQPLSAMLSVNDDKKRNVKRSASNNDDDEEDGDDGNFSS